MKTVIAVLITLTLLSACASPGDRAKEPAKPAYDLSQLVYENQTHVNRLSVGMSKAAAIDLMGAKSAPTHDGPVANPFRTEAFLDKGGAQYEILYYVTQMNRAFRPLRLEETTPLVFRNGVLLGWGSEALHRSTEQMAK